MIGKALSIAIVVLALNIESFAQSEAQVPDISGVYRSGRADSPCGRGANFARNPDCPVNDLGIAAFAKATPETDPGLECVADGLSRHFTRLPRPMEIIQTDDRIIMHYEYFDVWREIHLERDTPPPQTPHTLAGFSLGRWEGDTLVVETSHLVENVHTIPSSGQMTSVERYRWNQNRSLLLLDVEITDPMYYDGPFTLRTAEFTPNPTDYIAQFVCTSQTELFYGDINAFFDEN
jgi:hypothetical protein